MSTFYIPDSHFARRVKKAELSERIKLMQESLKGMEEQKRLIEKQQADLMKQIKETMNYSQLLADVLLEDEYNALIKNNL